MQSDLGHRPATSSSPSTPSRASPAYDNVSHPLDEYHSGYGYTDEQQVGPTPLAPALVYRTGHSRGQSLTNLLPASIWSRLQSPERTQQQSPEDYDMGLTGEGRKAFRQSAPQGFPIPQEPASEDCPSPETTPKRLVKSQTAGPIADTTPKNAAAAAAPAPTPNRLSLLSMFTKNSYTAVTAAEHEELLNMKVEEALFPAGSPTGKDAFSPAAYKNLQQQATGLLNKMQNAYRQKAQALSHLEKEREADKDELEEAETRATHLKYQLEDMAHKASEQEQRMKQLMEELAAERRARVEDRNSLMKRAPLQSEAGSTISEDLGVDDAEQMQKRKWRKSNGTDTSFETDDDSISLEGESVFSRPRSPSASTYTTTRGVETGSVIDLPLATPTSTRGPAPNRASVASNRKSTQQMSTFQKLMKGISGDGSDGCRNCKGQDSSIAWDTVSMLRDENKNLKSRVGELEDCLDGALDVVNGIGL